MLWFVFFGLDNMKYFVDIYRFVFEDTFILICNCYYEKDLVNSNIFLLINYTMADTMNYLFGPLGEEFCMWFYVLSIFGFVYLVLFLIPSIYFGLTRKTNMMYWGNVLAVSIGYFIFYFQNRLLHTMCVLKK